MKKPGKKLYNLQCQIAPDLKEWLAQQAKTERRTMTAIVEIVLGEYRTAQTEGKA